METHLTSELLYRDAFGVAIADLLFVAILAWRIKRNSFRGMKWPLVAASALFWSVFGLALYRVFWDTYYRYFAAAWMRDYGILLITLPHGIILALVFYWAALRLPFHPIVSVCLLGGLESWLEHLWGIFGWKILEIPMLQGVSPASTLAFAFPEYILYWCVVIAAACVFNKIWQWLKPGRSKPVTP